MELSGLPLKGRARAAESGDEAVLALALALEEAVQAHDEGACQFDIVDVSSRQGGSVSAPVLEQLLAALNNHKARVKKLLLFGNGDLGDDGAKAVAWWLRRYIEDHNEIPSEIHFSHCNISTSGFDVIINAGQGDWAPPLWLRVEKNLINPTAVCKYEEDGILCFAKNHRCTPGFCVNQGQNGRSPRVHCKFGMGQMGSATHSARQASRVPGAGRGSQRHAPQPRGPPPRAGPESPLASDPGPRPSGRPPPPARPSWGPPGPGSRGDVVHLPGGDFVQSGGFLFPARPSGALQKRSAPAVRPAPSSGHPIGKAPATFESPASKRRKPQQPSVTPPKSMLRDIWGVDDPMWKQAAPTEEGGNEKAEPDAAERPPDEVEYYEAIAGLVANAKHDLKNYPAWLNKFLKTMVDDFGATA